MHAKTVKKGDGIFSGTEESGGGRLGNFLISQDTRRRAFLDRDPRRGLPAFPSIPSRAVAIPPFLTPNVVAEHEGVENRSAQPRDYRSTKGYAAEGRKERDGDKLGRRKPLQTPPVSLTLFSFLGRLLDDFMPHKNDIKFVKTERRNDRYGSAVWSGRLRAGEKSKSWKGGKREGEKRKSKQIAEDGRPLTIFARG